MPHLPAALLLLWSAGAGTFFTGTHAGWTIAGHLGLWIFIGAFGVVWPDPLRLGKSGRWLLLALAASVLASYLASPVTRAGRLAILLLPAFSMVPSAVAGCWPNDRARRLGLRSISLVVTAVAGWTLVGWWRWHDSPAASWPLGHPNLQAAWLLALLPLAALPWRDGGPGRAFAAPAGALGLAALGATGSLAAALAAGGVLMVWAARWSRGRRGWTIAALAAGALVLAAQLPRLGAVARGLDPSTSARWSYIQAGWRGLLERPMLGWGPGSARWTLAEHLRPIPGLHPPDQEVVDPHCLPLLLGYELGVSGLLLAAGVAAVFVWRRREVVDPGLRRAALLGLAALTVMSLAGRTLAAPAIPFAAMLAAGAMLAAEEPAARRRKGRAASIAVALLTAILAAPLDLAQLAYDRAAGAGDRDVQRLHLRRAVTLDPAFPLYRARLAWLEAGGGEAARRALAAAAAARAVAPLWTVAGILGQETGETWSRDALVRACRLSPLGVVAPYRLTFEDESDDLRAQWTARALLAEPLLLAAVAWRDREPLLRAAVDRLGRLDGVDAGWHAWLERTLDRRPGLDGGPVRVLSLAMDSGAVTSVSVYAFRRRPWPIDLARIEISGRILEAVEAGTAGTPRGDVLRHPRCGL